MVPGVAVGRGVAVGPGVAVGVAVGSGVGVAVGAGVGVAVGSCGCGCGCRDDVAVERDSAVDSQGSAVEGGPGVQRDTLIGDDGSGKMASHSERGRASHLPEDIDRVAVEERNLRSSVGQECGADLKMKSGIGVSLGVQRQDSAKLGESVEAIDAWEKGEPAEVNSGQVPGRHFFGQLVERAEGAGVGRDGGGVIAVKDTVNHRPRWETGDSRAG